MNRATAIALAIALVTATGCGGRWIPQPTDADAARASAKWPGTTTASLARGRKLLLSHCGNCHLPPSPADHAATEWSEEVGEMRERSGLTLDDAALVERYLVTFAKQP